MSAQAPERVSRHQLKTMEATLLAELLEEIRLERAQTTRELARLRSGIVNDVLSSGLVLLDANGQYTEAFFTPFGSLAIANHGTTDVVVQNGPAGQGAPARGKGVHRVPAGLERVLNISATEYTLYGAAGQALSVEVFSRAQPPTSGGAASQVAQLAVLTGIADAVAGASIPETGKAVFNGATWDRLRALGAAGDGLGVQLASQPSSTAPASVNANNAAATITFAAVVGQRHRLTGLWWSYTAAAAAGRLTVTDGATVLVDQDLITAAAAAGQLFLPPGGIQGTPNTNLVVTLAAGGVGNIGKISASRLTA